MHVEVVDKTGSKVGELAVSDMEKSLDQAGNLGIDPDSHLGLIGDSDRFHIRIPSLDGDHQVSVKLATVNNPDPSYNDDATVVKMHKKQGAAGYESLGQVLVSGAVDGEIRTGEEITLENPNPTSKHKRTHHVQLGGNVQITELKIGGLEIAIDLQIPVPVKRTVNLNVVIINDAATPDIAAEIKSANEMYASMGIRLEMTGNPTVQPPLPPLIGTIQSAASELNLADISDLGRYLSHYGTTNSVEDIS